MSYIISKEEALPYIALCIEQSLKSSCHRSRCGSVIVSNDVVIGSGYNSMPCDVVASCFKDSLLPGFKSDKTCCIHAEQRAIMNALSSYPNLIKGSRLYFIRIDEEGNAKLSGDPYCTICSKMALDSGISEFVLAHKSGYMVYDTFEYNELSFRYTENK